MHPFRILFFLLASNVCIAASTKLDSLKRELKESRSKERSLSLLSHIGYEFFSQKQYDSSLYYCYQSLKEGAIAGSLSHVASSFSTIATCYSVTGPADSVIYYYDKAMAIFDARHDTSNMVSLKVNFAIFYKNSGYYEKTLKESFDALPVLERQPADKTLASCYNTIGAVYFLIKEYDECLRYYRKALSVRLKINYLRGVGQSYNNLGEVYIELQQPDSALLYLSKAIETKTAAQDTRGLFSTLNLRGEVLLKLHRTDEANQSFHHSLVKAREVKDIAGEIAALNNIGRVNLERRDFKDAEQSLRTASELIKQAASLELKRKNLEYRLALYEALGKFQLALQASRELIDVKDSLLTKDKVESLISLQTRYETEKKEEEIKLLEQSKALQLLEIDSNKKWIENLIIILLLGCLIGVLLIIGYRTSVKNRKKVETLMKELHHRVKNNLQILSSVLSLQAQHLTDKDSLRAIKSSESRVNTMALIHKKLYSDEISRTIDVVEYIRELTLYLMQTYGFDRENMKLTVSGGAIMMDVDKAIPVGLILNELISNALKYAYGEQPAPTLVIDFRTNRHNEVVIELADNGPGMAETDIQKPISFGLKMVQILIRELKAKLDSRTDRGTMYRILIPID